MFSDVHNNVLFVACLLSFGSLEFQHLVSSEYLHDQPSIKLLGTVSNELPWETLHTFCHNITGSSPCVTPLGRREFMPGVLCTSPNTLLPLCTYFVFFSYNKS